MIGQTISHYRIIEPLGEGGMGKVYLAEDTHLGRQVAIKFLSSLDPHYRARFLREARAVSALSHPNIAAVYDYGESEKKQPYLVMELVRGVTLSDLLEDERLPVSRAIAIVSSIGEALDEAHSQGIVHRDVKPANVIINERGQVKVLDFGLVKHFNEPHKSADTTMSFAHTQSDVIVGTPLYLSPEQATGKAVDGRSDLFALGALLYECLTGQSAFSGSSVIEIGAQVIHVTPEPPSKTNPRVTAALDRVTMKALEKKPDARYQSAAEMVADLKKASTTLAPEGEGPDQFPPRVVSGVRASALHTITQTMRRPRLSIATFLLGIVVVGFIVWAGVRYWKPAPYEPTSDALDFYIKGTDALRNGAYMQASKDFERSIAADEQFALAHARLAEAYAELDYADKGKDELLRVATLVPERSVLPQLDGLYLAGIHATATRDFSGAVKAFDEIAHINKNDAHVYVDLGRAWEKNGEVDKALENYIKATTLDGQYATAYLRAGDIYSRKTDIASASSAFDKANALFTALKNTEAIAEVMRQRGVLFRILGRYPEAQAQFELALQTAKANGHEPQEVLVLIELAYLAFSEGKTARAQEYAKEAVAYARQKRLENLTVGGLIELGNAASSFGDYPEAERYFLEAIELARANGGPRREATAKMNLSGVRLHQQRTDEAMALVQEALNFFRQGNYPRSVSLALNFVARVHRQKGEYDAALKVLREKLELAEKGGDQPEIAFAHGEIGSVLAERENYTEALKEYTASYEINRSLDNKLQLAYNLHNRGNMFWQLGRYDDARRSLEECLAMVNQPDNKYKALRAELELSFAQIALSEGQWPVAQRKALEAAKLGGEQYKQVTVAAKDVVCLAKTFSGNARAGIGDCEASLEMAKSSGDAGLLTRTMIALATASLESGNTAKALQLATEARQRAESARQKESLFRASVVAAIAAERSGDVSTAQTQKVNAEKAFADLRTMLGEYESTYLARRDQEFYRKLLG